MTQDVLDDFPTPAPVARLTRRESVVLSHLHQGLTLDEIAARLFVSRNTVKTQVRSLYRKLGVSSRAEAIAPLGPARAAAPQPWSAPVVPRHTCAGGPARSEHDLKPVPPPCRDTRAVGSRPFVVDRRPAERAEPHTAAREARVRPRAGSGRAPTLRVLPSEPADAVVSPAPSRSAASTPVPGPCLACLAERREAARAALDAIDAAIACEVSATRSDGANWTEIAAALGMTRQAARRRFEDRQGAVVTGADGSGGRW